MFVNCIFTKLCVCVCVFLLSPSAREKKTKAKRWDQEDVRGSLRLSQPLPFLCRKTKNKNPTTKIPNPDQRDEPTAGLASLSLTCIEIIESLWEHEEEDENCFLSRNFDLVILKRAALKNIQMQFFVDFFCSFFFFFYKWCVFWFAEAGQSSGMWRFKFPNRIRSSNRNQTISNFSSFFPSIRIFFSSKENPQGFDSFALLNCPLQTKKKPNTKDSLKKNRKKETKTEIIVIRQSDTEHWREAASAAMKTRRGTRK